MRVAPHNHSLTKLAGMERSKPVDGAVPIFHTDPSRWVMEIPTISDTGYTWDGTGAVSRTIHDKLAEFVSVKDYGATGDGSTDDTSAIQAALDDLSHWSLLYFPAGTYVVSDTLVIGFSQYKMLAGAGNGATIIQQATDNTPILQANRKNTHNILMRDFTLAFLNQQDATMTNGYCLQFASEVSNASGFYWWKIHNVSFLNAYIGMGILQQTGFKDLWWGFDCENLFFSHIQHNAISSLAAVTTGRPANLFRNTKIFNTQSTVVSDSAAIWLSGCEATFITLDIEGWYNECIHVAGGGLCNITDLHIEHHTVTNANQYIFFVANGPALVQGASFSGTMSPASGSASVFQVTSSGVLEAKDILNTFTTTAGTTSFLSGTSGTVRMQNITNSAASSPAITIPSAISGSNAIVVRWDDNFYGNGLVIGNGTRIKNHLSGTATWDPASLNDGETATTTVSVTGAASGDTVAIGFTSIASAGWQISGVVTSADTVAVTLTNHTGGAVDLASGTVRADVWKH